MGSRDHLVPSMTVDRNGFAKTVYVSPDRRGSQSSSLSSAVPTLARFEQTEEDDEYGDDTGFGEEWDGVSDPDSWEANGFSADDAHDWEHEGFDANDSYHWRNCGYDPSEAKEWSAAGFDHAGASAWSGEGFNPDDAQSWSNKGFDADNAIGWRNEAFDDPDTASEWSNEGFDPSEAIQWYEGGFKEAIDASNWKDANRGNRGVDISDLATLFEHDLMPEDAQMWMSVLEQVKRTKEGEGETLNGLVRTLDGVNPSAGDEYLNDFTYPDEWRILASAHIEFDKVQAVRTAYQLIDDHQQDEYGDDYEEDRAGTLEEAADWIGRAERFTLSKSQAIFSLIRDGHRPSAFDVFLAHDGLMDYGRGNADAMIIKAQQWAVTSTGNDAPMKEKTGAFGKFYSALQSIDGMDEIIEQHGASKVGAAMQQGMLTEPTLRNYLDHIPIAAISEGAL